MRFTTEEARDFLHDALDQAEPGFDQYGNITRAIEDLIDAKIKDAFRDAEIVDGKIWDGS